ncbi:hypothetical protein RYX36_010712, partial [Vicia faba]
SKSLLLLANLLGPELLALTVTSSRGHSKRSGTKNFQRETFGLGVSSTLIWRVNSGIVWRSLKKGSGKSWPLLQPT